MSKPIVNTNANGVRTVKVLDIIQSKEGKEGLAKATELFKRLQAKHLTGEPHGS